MTKRAPPRTAFRTGESGNPRGRPRLPEDIKDILRQLHRPAVLKLGQLLMSPDERVALRAVEVVIERNQGRAPQPLDVSARVEGVGAITAINSDELLLILRRLSEGKDDAQ